MVMGTQGSHGARGPESAAAEVTVQLSGCGRDDAQTVFAVLGGAYGCDRGAAGPARETPGAHPTVWSAAVDVTETGEIPEAARLEDTVTADVQGSPQSVSKVKDTLGERFSVQVLGLTAGDQEQELRLRVGNR